MARIAVNAVPAHVELPPDTVLTTLPRGVWFSAVGEPLTQSELDEARSYVHALGFKDVTLAGVVSWADAKSISQAPNWRRDWWQVEQAEERRLLTLASQRYGADAVMRRMTHILEGSAELFLGPAAVAGTRAGVADSALARAAAGAASQSLHQSGLAMLAGESSDHLFGTKFRLFLAGRWPLSINDNTFYIF